MTSMEEKREEIRAGSEETGCKATGSSHLGLASAWLPPQTRTEARICRIYLLFKQNDRREGKHRDYKDMLGRMSQHL